MRRDCRVTTSRGEVPGTSFRGQRWLNARHSVRTRSVSAHSRKRRPSRARRYGAQWPPRARRRGACSTSTCARPITTRCSWLSLDLANAVKLNEEELPVVARLCGLEHGTPLEQLRELCGRFGLRLAALTRGA